MADAFVIDGSSDLGARAAAKLRESPVVWLTTVTPSGAPSPNPVWFLWDGAAEVRSFALPSSARVAHLRSNPHVTLTFDGNGQGGDIVVLNATATLEPEAAKADAVPDYLAKYASHLPGLNLTPEAFAQAYSVPIRIQLTKLRGHA
jgi:PPOX class probable F420-dependent enzyme